MKPNFKLRSQQWRRCRWRHEWISCSDSKFVFLLWYCIGHFLSKFRIKAVYSILRAVAKWQRIENEPYWSERYKKMLITKMKKIHRAIGSFRFIVFRLKLQPHHPSEVKLEPEYISPIRYTLIKAELYRWTRYVRRYPIRFHYPRA